MTPQSLLPDNWILTTGVFFWLPGEVLSRRLLGIVPPRFGRNWHLLLITPFLLGSYAFLQLNAGMGHEGRLLIKLAVTCLLGCMTYIYLTRADTSAKDSEEPNELAVYSCSLFGYYAAFLTLVWWLPAGVKSIWIWPLQFEPRLITFCLAIISASLALVSTNGRLKVRVSLALSSAACLFWQIAGILAKSISVDEIAHSDKITGYLTASRLFSSTIEIASSYTGRIGSMPFHVNTHPAGKVLLMKIIDSLDPTNAANTWAIMIVASVCLVVPVTFKISRILNANDQQAILVATSVGMIPSLALFCPGFDAYTAFICTTVLLIWIKGLTSIGPASLACWALSLGVIGYSLLTFSYTGLVFGSVLIAWTPWILVNSNQNRSARSNLRRVLILAVGGLSSLLCMDTVLYAVTGYSSIKSLFYSIGVQRTIEASNRTGINAFVLDFSDFGYGISPIILSLMLAVFAISAFSYCIYFKHDLLCGESDDSAKLHFWRGGSLISLNFLAILSVALTGFLDIETARVWIMLMPATVISTLLWASKRCTKRTCRSIISCQVLWGVVLLLRYQFLF